MKIYNCQQVIEKGRVKNIDINENLSESGKQSINIPLGKEEMLKK